MRYIKIFVGFIIFSSCNRQSDRTQILQMQIDSLQAQLNNTYKPGLGEFMSGIQVHHAKLWFAGQGRNWKLADFEVNEIKESIEDIKKYCTDRPEVKSIGMIVPAIDSVYKTIQLKDAVHFKNSYVLLTATCNNCHRATNHEYNVIKIPNNQPFSNQVFEAVK
jgi:hypothetical protein